MNVLYTHSEAELEQFAADEEAVRQQELKRLAEEEYERQVDSGEIELSEEETVKRAAKKLRESKKNERNAAKQNRPAGAADAKAEKEQLKMQGLYVDEVKA